MKLSNQLSELLATLDSTPGVSGFEEPVAEVLQQKMNGYYDDFYEDVLGNNIFIHKGSDTDLKVMICAHMDEIGFIVSTIEESGLVRFVPVGFHTDRVVIAQEFAIHTEKGPVYGITGSKPFHLLTPEEEKQVITMNEMYIDIGTTSRKETEDLGVRPGDSITFSRKGYFLNNSKFFCGKSVDNRAGLAVMVEVMKRLKGENIIPSVYAVGSVQEELGCRGAGTIANKIKPDVAIALDVTLSGGTPGIEEKDTPVLMGKGAAIVFYHWSPQTACAGNTTPRRLTQKLVKVAEANNIAYQRDILMGAASDAWTISLSGSGVLTGSIMFPSRYIHSSIGTVHMDDLQSSVDLLISYIKQIRTKNDLIIER